MLFNGEGGRVLLRAFFLLLLLRDELEVESELEFILELMVELILELILVVVVVVDVAGCEDDTVVVVDDGVVDAMVAVDEDDEVDVVEGGFENDVVPAPAPAPAPAVDDDDEAAPLDCMYSLSAWAKFIGIDLDRGARNDVL